VTDLTLFGAGTPEPAEKLSEGRRRTLRQKQAMEHGSHPLSLLGAFLRLHPEAPPAGDRKAPGPRCGTCRFAEGNVGGYLKCTRGRSGEIGTPSFRRGPYETHGGGSDLRAYWPACERYES
jgi:hypothetical protein